MCVGCMVCFDIVCIYSDNIEINFICFNNHNWHQVSIAYFIRLCFVNNESKEEFESSVSFTKQKGG